MESKAAAAGLWLFFAPVGCIEVTVLNHWLGKGALDGGEPLEGDGNITPREMTASAGQFLQERPTTEPGLQPPFSSLFCRVRLPT